MEPVPEDARQDRPWLETSHQLVILTLLALLSCAPLICAPWWYSHERVCYLERALEYQRMWQAGYWYPRWASDFYFGLGSPFFNYYAPLVYALTAALMSLFHFNVLDALKLLIALVSIAGTLGVYGLVRGETRRTDAAILAAGLFLFMPYRFTDLWIRGDLAELTAFSLLPYPFWLYRAVLRVPKRSTALIAAVAAVTHVLVIFAHTITGMLGTEALVLLLLPTLIGAWRAGERTRVLLIAMALAGAVGLSSVYTVPAMLEGRYVHLDWLLTELGDIHQNIRHNGVELAALLGDEYDYFYYVGEAIPVGALVATLLLLRRATRAAALRTVRWWLVTLVSVILVLQPFTPFWEVLPLGRFVQFPWRMLGIACVTGAVAAGLTWAAATRPSRITWVLSMLLLALFAVGGARYDFMPVRRYPLPPTVDLTKDADGTTINHEYLPVAVLKAPLDRARFPALPNPGARIIALQRHGIGYRVQFTADGPTSVDLAAHWFPGWQSETLSGPSGVRLTTSPIGWMRIEVSNEGEYDVSIELHQTGLQKVATAGSIATLLLLFPALLWVQRRTRSVTA